MQSLNAADGGDTHAMLNVDAMKDVAKALGKWPSDATHGPVLLAWATLLSLAPSAASGLGRRRPRADPAKMSARAAGGDAGFDSRLSLLRTDYIKGIGHACKSVLKLFTVAGRFRRAARAEAEARRARHAAGYPRRGQPRANRSSASSSGAARARGRPARRRR